jgi:transcriptional regulator with XRE-family HTH domain
MYTEMTTPNGRRIKAAETVQNFEYENIKIMADETGSRHVVRVSPPIVEKKKIDHSVFLTPEIIALFDESKTVAENLLMYREKTGASTKTLAAKFELSDATVKLYLKGKLPGVIGMGKLQKVIGFSHDYANAHTKPTPLTKDSTFTPKNKLRQLRKALGKSQMAVAHDLNMSNTYVSYLECNKPKHNAAWQTIADYYGMTIAELELSND